ncbi:hypothetical protein MSAR_16620 [Mycolicibacterium sarraceniae]|uniref:Uncharacterized protein n=1 Tax=Mycolicibacterium sarraceniae TaxID=1534348 RepID=A0A7I7SRU1_9MYCO|nr:hypothetical protein MSAR_16620 [Mycolicibacterium sarraceniae]
MTVRRRTPARTSGEGVGESRRTPDLGGWIKTVSADHVQRGVAGGFTQANHGKPHMLRTMEFLPCTATPIRTLLDQLEFIVDPQPCQTPTATPRATSITMCPSRFRGPAPNSGFSSASWPADTKRFLQTAQGR